MAQAERELRILEVLERDPEVTQAGLAAQLGVAVGSVNWYLKRLIRKGYVKATRMKRSRLRYFVTPRGIALKAKLTAEYLRASLRVYRDLRQAARKTLRQVRAEGFTAVHVDGDGEAMEIFCLTCMEDGMPIERDSSALPVVRVEGMGFTVEWPGEE